MSTWGKETTSEEIASTYADRIKGKNIVITGVRPSSVGLAMVSALAPYAKTIIVATRTVSKAEEGLEETRKSNPDLDVRVVALDLLSSESIHQAASTILGYDIPIHVLVNNAAIAPGPLHHTANGFEVQMAGSHLGHFIFTSFLFPAIMNSKSADWQPRIVNLSSIAALEDKEPRWDDMHYTLRPEEYEPYVAYGRVKATVSLFSVGLAEKYGEGGKGLLAYSVHPGGILETALAQTVPREFFVKRGVLDENGKPLRYLKTPSSGAATSMYAAFSPDLITRNGAYLSDCAVVEATPDYIKSPENAEKAWKFSEEAWGIKFGVAP